MELFRLSLKDRPLFERYLKRAPRRLSAYAFPVLYVWKALYDIHWSIVDDALCVFFRDKVGAFLFLPPLGGCFPDAVRAAFAYMDGVNRSSAVSRIENIDEHDVSAYRGLGLRVYEKPPEYVCSRIAIAHLRGTPLRSYRNARNYCMKHYEAVCRDYCGRYAEEVGGLFRLWMKQRRARYPDKLYQGMLEDSGKCLHVALRDFDCLGLKGIVVTIDEEVRAFSCGCPLSKDDFCIMYEFTDVSAKGLAAYTFSSFCRELTSFSSVNIMDDSGLENLRRSKRSWHPREIVPAYVAARPA